MYQKSKYLWKNLLCIKQIYECCNFSLHAIFRVENINSEFFIAKKNEKFISALLVTFFDTFNTKNYHRTATALEPTKQKRHAHTIVMCQFSELQRALSIFSLSRVHSLQTSILAFAFVRTSSPSCKIIKLMYEN